MRNFVIIGMLVLISCNTKNQKQIEDKSSNDNLKKQETLKVRKPLQVQDLVADSEFFLYSTINGHVFKSNREMVLWDEKRLPIASHFGIVYYDGQVYACERQDTLYNFYKILESGNVEKQGYLVTDYVYVTYNNFYLVKNNILYSIKPDNQKLLKIYDFNSKINNKEGRVNKIEVVNQLSNNFIVVEINRFHSGCYDFDAYIVNLKNNELIYDNNYRMHEPDNEIFKACFFLADENTNEFFAYFFSSNKYPSEKGYLFDSNFEIIDTLPNKDDYISFQCAHCEYSSYIAGVNIVDNELVNIYLGVYYRYGNDRIKYFLPYRYNTELEKVLAKLYNSRIIKKEELNVLNNYELEIAKNFIFAKYNYQFDNKFYQAYFSTFKFYNSDEFAASRTKDVNQKLNEIDLYNLDLIKNYPQQGV